MSLLDKDICYNVIAKHNVRRVNMAKSKKNMTKQEIEDWERLYEYVRCNVLGYDENQSLSKVMVLRLKGLTNNKFIANNNIEDTANYPYDVVLNAFKFSIMDINKALRTVDFKDEMHKFNYILKIVEPNINTVYMRMKNADKAKEKTETINMNAQFYEGAEYKVTETNTSSKLNDLW